jgi:hypothetical protein
VSLGNAVNFINAWLLVILFRFCMQKLLCNYELISYAGGRAL